MEGNLGMRYLSIQFRLFRELVVTNCIQILLIVMEQKRLEIKEYLRNTLNPLLKPLVQEITKERPADIMKFILDYATKSVNDRKHEKGGESDQNQENHDEEEFRKKMEAKKKNKFGKKNSRHGISAEAFGDYNKKADFVPKIIHKDDHTKKTIQKLLLKSIVFQNLTADQLKVVIDAMEEIKFKAEDKVISEGEQGDVLYVVNDGQYECTKIINGKQTYLKTYKTGDIFGELALMYNAKRAASIKCSKPGTLYSLDRGTFTNIVQESAIKKRKYYANIIGKVEILSEIENHEREQLCDVFKEESFMAGDYIVKQGDKGDRLYFVIEGKLEAEKKDEKGQTKPVFNYKEGDYFGEIALIKNTVRQASIKALTSCVVVSIDRDCFVRLLGPIEHILQRNMQKYKKFVQK